MIMDDGVITRWLDSEDLSHLSPSFAQNFEDVILARVLSGNTGFYIDAGANDPVHHSVTKHFYDKGWSGVNIEPHRGFYRRLCADRPRDVNLNMALSDCETVVTFHEEPSGAGISSLTEVFADWNVGLTVEDRPIAVTTLARICERYADRQIDFLKIDVEGVERQVCQGGDWAKYRPRIVLIEAPWADFFEDWDSWFKDRDYLFAYFDGINRFYARREDRDLIPTLAVPYNSLDRAIPYQLSRLITMLQRELAESRRRESDGIARRVGRLSRRLPGVASRVKQLFG
jgi:FkbM family methyltransferase